MKKSRETITVPIPRPKKRIGVLPTRREESAKERANKRHSKHKGREQESSEYGGEAVKKPRSTAGLLLRTLGVRQRFCMDVGRERRNLL
jgi:hypothetical protein